MNVICQHCGKPWKAIGNYYRCRGCKHHQECSDVQFFGNWVAH